MSKSEIYLGSELLDFNGEVNIRKQVNDFRDMDIGSADRSYTLEIPLTKNNIRLLGYIDDIRSRTLVTDQARAVLNGIEAIRGSFRILSTDDREARAIIEGRDWIGDIGGISIKDLSWGVGDEHIFSSSNIQGSWTAAAGAFYRYPLINFGELYSEDSGENSKVYPYDFYPMWRIGDIIERIFNDAGYQIDPNNFFETTPGKKLYILSAPVPQEAEFITEKGLLVYVDGDLDNYDQALGVADDGYFQLQVNKVLQIEGKDTDEGSDFSTGTYRYTAPADGTYRFQTQIKVRSSGNDDGDDTDMEHNSITWSIRKNGTILETYTDTETATPEPTIFDGQPTFDLDTGWIYLDEDDYIDIYIAISVSGYNRKGTSQDYYLYIVNGVNNSYLLSTWDERNRWPGIGQTISPSVYLPDIESLDFLRALRKAFNLRIWMDKPNMTVYISTADDFYGDMVIDWSDKVDYSEGIDLKMAASNYKRNQVLKWKEDTGDRAYNEWVTLYGLPGIKELELNNGYAQDGVEERINKIFSYTVTPRMIQIGNWYFQIPKIVGDQDYINEYTTYPLYRATKWEPRILSWQGLTALTSGGFNYHEDIEDLTPDNYTSFPNGSPLSMSDLYSSYQAKDWRRIDENKILTCTLKLSMPELMKFITVINNPDNEGFRATYRIDINGNPMYWICSKIITDGDRVKAEFIQKI